MRLPWASLASVEFDYLPVSLHLYDVSLPEALSVLVRQPLNGVRLGYYIEDGCLVLTSKKEAEKHAIVRVYDVSDLLPPPGPEAPGAAAVIQRLQSVSDL